MAFRSLARVVKPSTSQLLWPRAATATAQAQMPQRRWLNIHEIDSCDLLTKNGINTARSIRAYSPEEAVRCMDKLGTDRVVVKAQVLAGGRGKGTFDNGFKGGVKIVNGESELFSTVKQMVGHTLFTAQTGEEGRPCHMVQVAECVDVKSEMYLAILLDRASAGPCLVGSKHGGMNIEEVAAKDPDAIIKMNIDIFKGLTEDQAIEMARKIGVGETSIDEAAEQMLRLYSLFIKTDCTQVEINPLVEDTKGKVMCLDAKLNFDDNAEFRQKNIYSLRDTSQERAQDVEASKWDLNFIGLDGNIGCLVNGAGLAMATMDIIQHYDGSPANFLDVGGGATAEQVTAAFRLITSDPKVSAILVNIFGGIMRCDVIAEGIVKATSELSLTVPVIVRLQGTRKLEAKALIAASGLDIVSTDDLDHAAVKAVTACKIVELARDANLSVKFKNVYEMDQQDSAEWDGRLTPNST